MRMLLLITPWVVWSLIGCSDESNLPPGTNDMGPASESSTMQLKITDAPIDQANVESCMVTISEIHANGQRLEGFQKTSVDLMKYRNGATFDLGSYDVEAQSDVQLSLILDYSEDEEGNSPGCYVLEADGTRHALSMESKEIILNEQMDLSAQTESTYIIDMDLRKMVAENDDSNQSAYRFVSRTDAEAAIRLVADGMHGTVSGQVTLTSESNQHVVAYIYPQNEFDASVESSQQGSGRLRFKNAINSSLCDDNGNFELHFMEEGNYELVFAAYENDENGKLTFQGIFSLSGDILLNDLVFENVQVQANSQTQLSLNLFTLISI